MSEETGNKLDRIRITREVDEETRRLTVFWEGNELVRYVE